MYSSAASTHHPYAPSSSPSTQTHPSTYYSPTRAARDHTPAAASNRSYDVTRGLSAQQHQQAYDHTTIGEGHGNAASATAMLHQELQAYQNRVRHQTTEREGGSVHSNLPSPIATQQSRTDDDPPSADTSCDAAAVATFEEGSLSDGQTQAANRGHHEQRPLHPFELHMYNILLDSSNNQPQQQDDQEPSHQQQQQQHLSGETFDDNKVGGGGTPLRLCLSSVDNHLYNVAATTAAAAAATSTTSPPSSSTEALFQDLLTRSADRNNSGNTQQQHEGRRIRISPHPHHSPSKGGDSGSNINSYQPQSSSSASSYSYSGSLLLLLQNDEFALRNSLEALEIRARDEVEEYFASSRPPPNPYWDHLIQCCSEFQNVVLRLRYGIQTKYSKGYRQMCVEMWLATSLDRCLQDEAAGRDALGEREHAIFTDMVATMQYVTRVLEPLFPFPSLASRRREAQGGALTAASYNMGDNNNDKMAGQQQHKGAPSLNLLPLLEVGTYDDLPRPNTLAVGTRGGTTTTTTDGRDRNAQTSARTAMVGGNNDNNTAKAKAKGTGHVSIVSRTTILGGAGDDGDECAFDDERDATFVPSRATATAIATATKEKRPPGYDDDDDFVFGGPKATTINKGNNKVQEEKKPPAAATTASPHSSASPVKIVATSASSSSGFSPSDRAPFSCSGVHVLVSFPPSQSRKAAAKTTPTRTTPPTSESSASAQTKAKEEAADVSPLLPQLEGEEARKQKEEGPESSTVSASTASSPALPLSAARGDTSVFAPPLENESETAKQEEKTKTEEQPKQQPTKTKQQTARKQKGSGDKNRAASPFDSSSSFTTNSSSSSFSRSASFDNLDGERAARKKPVDDGDAAAWA